MKLNINELELADYNVISDEEFLRTMEETVDPYIEARKETKNLPQNDGWTIHCELYTADEAKATVFISHGFAESTLKYHEVIYYFLREGYNIVIIDHRNHGKSRPALHGDVAMTPTHIERFDRYIEDVNKVVETVMKPKFAGPYYLYAHSMGGCIAVNYIEKYTDVFPKVVLNAPMLEINRHGIPLSVTRAVMAWNCAVGNKEKFMISQTSFVNKENFEASAGTSYPRYTYYWRYQTVTPNIQSAGASFGWCKESYKACEKAISQKECNKVKAEVLLFQAEDDFFVSPGGQDTFISRILKGTLVFVPDTKHEIYMCKTNEQKKYWTKIFEFLK